MTKPAERITVSRSKRGVTIKASGAAAQALFDVLTADVRGKHVLAADAAAPGGGQANAGAPAAEHATGSEAPHAGRS